MSISEIVARSNQADAAGTRERLNSPAIVQAGRAVRHSTGQQRWAKTKEAATADDHITCDLLDSAGDAVEEIEVYCTILNGTALNQAGPRLISDITIPVAYYLGQWRCGWGFDTDEECVCTPP